jgi:hypothetical protein
MKEYEGRENVVLRPFSDNGGFPLRRSCLFFSASMGYGVRCGGGGVEVKDLVV